VERLPGTNSLVCAAGLAAVADSSPPYGRYLARQPILDVTGCVVAYELLFRSGAVSSFDGSGDAASRTMIDNTLIYGLGSLTTGLPAFINCTADTLTSQYIHMLLPRAWTVLEVLEDVEPTADVVKACIELQRRGYKIALDDFQYRPSLDPLIRIADYIKIDFRETSADQRLELMACRKFKGAHIAEKVETLEEYQQAKKEAFTLFQGYYFCRPMLLRKKSVPSNRVVHLRLLNLMQECPLNIAEVGELVRSEPSLAYRLLRYVNSAGRGMHQEIGSIEIALLAVGDDLFRRIATLAVAVGLNCAPSPEILRMALVRARFCEAAAMLCDLSPTEQYLLGLFSLLDAMLQMPMEEALAPLSLSAPIRDALLGANNPNRRPLYWLESHERGDFDRCDQLAAAYGFAPDLLIQTFSAATLWADSLLVES
jgi:EAL and modified HD-GYP domain-containing signal transduction protein